jgi:IS5 family transposase
MPLIERYWLDDKSVPFGTFLRYLEKYYSPEVHDDNFELLVSRARLAAPEDAGMATFKDELSRLLRGDREGLHPHAIITAAEYGDWKTDDEFLLWLWRELYPDEATPTEA